MEAINMGKNNHNLWKINFSNNSAQILLSAMSFQLSMKIYLECYTNFVRV